MGQVVFGKFSVVELMRQDVLTRMVGNPLSSRTHPYYQQPFSGAQDQDGGALLPDTWRERGLIRGTIKFSIYE